MRPVTVTLALEAADDNAIAESQTPGGAGNLTLDGALATDGVATLVVPQFLLLTTAADETGKTFTFYYTDRYGTAQTYATAGVNNTTKVIPINAKTVTRIAVSAATAGAILVGITAVGTTKWLPVNWHAADFQLGFACVVTGTVNYHIEYCWDGLFDVGFNEADATAFVDANITNETSSQSGSYTGGPMTGVRLKINSGTGSVQMTMIQSNVAG
jgi:hypothetical protein